jgi:hypothetical protein
LSLFSDYFGNTPLYSNINYRDVPRVDKNLYASAMSGLPNGLLHIGEITTNVNGASFVYGNHMFSSE